MIPISRNELEELMRHRSPACLTMLMPASRKGEERLQGPIRLKHMMQRAEDELLKLGLTKKQMMEQLSAAREWIRDDDFWEHQLDGVAFFISPGFFRVFNVSIALEEQLVAADRFYLKPLFPLLEEHAKFHILALTQKQVRLFEADHNAIQPADLPGAPAGLNEIMDLFVTDRQQRFHTETAAGAPGARRSPVYFGRGVGTDSLQMKAHIFEYCRLVDLAVNRKLTQRSEPLVLASVEPLSSIYREANTYPRLNPQSVTSASQDYASMQDLHLAALKISKLFYDEAPRRQAAARYRELAGSGKSVHDIKQILAAAHQGQIDTLFISIGDHLWGQYNATTSDYRADGQRQPGDDDLLDQAAVEAWLSYGKVFAVQREEIPDQEVAAAILRYA
jgi:hypothetical protein